MTQQVAPIPASTQDYLRPWQNPELVIDPQLHQHFIRIDGLAADLGAVLAGPGALAQFTELTGVPLMSGQPSEVIIILVMPPAPQGKKNITTVALTYKQFEQQMDSLELDCVTTPGFYPYWLEAATGVTSLPNGMSALPVNYKVSKKGHKLVQRLFKNGRI